MLLKSYKTEIFRSKCNPAAQSVHCHAHLSDDIGQVLPYLNSRLCGFTYTVDPPSVSFRAQGKLITVHSNKIAINALQDEAEAEKILLWLKREINDTWNKRNEIDPKYEGEGFQRPQVIEILKCLPKTNCGECNEPTCMVFSTRVAEGVKAAEDCKPIDPSNRDKLNAYMEQFDLID